MANKCDFIGIGRQVGRNVSFSQRKTRKVWKPNLHTKRLVIDGKRVKLKLSARAIRHLKKSGVIATS